VLVESCGDTSAFWWFAANFAVSSCVRSDQRNHAACTQAPGWRVAPSAPRVMVCHLGQSVVPGLAAEYADHFLSWPGRHCPRLAGPSVFLYNKFGWVAGKGRRPPRYHTWFNATTLEPLRRLLRGRATLLYNRPELAMAQAELAENKSLSQSAASLVADADGASGLRQLEGAERQWLAAAQRAGGVVSVAGEWLRQQAAWPGSSFNHWQLCMMAQARAFLSVQGGPSRVSLLFRKP